MEAQIVRSQGTFIVDEEKNPCLNNVCISQGICTGSNAVEHEAHVLMVLPEDDTEYVVPASLFVIDSLQNSKHSCLNTWHIFLKAYLLLKLSPPVFEFGCFMFQ